MRSILALLITATAVLQPARLNAQRIAEVQVAPPYLRLLVDSQALLVATAYDTDGNPVTAPVRWRSSNIHVAEVGPDGTVRARAPGVTIVRAYVEASPRPRPGQTTVFVLPPAPGGPAAQPYVFVHPAPPPSPPPRGELDSIIRSRIDCSEPFINSANPLRACWDRRPRPRARPMLDAPASCAEPLRHVRLIVLVSESGTAEEVRVVVPSTCPAYDELVLNAVRRLAFEPAQRAGQPVRAWMQLTLAPDPKRAPPP
jgi:TonB family protein